jgi:hypothetical protein
VRPAPHSAPQDCAAATVRDAAGTIVSVGEIMSSEYGSYGDSTFTIPVGHVKRDGDYYSIEISHRGEISFTFSSANNLALTLGQKKAPTPSVSMGLVELLHEPVRQGEQDRQLL